MTYHVPDNEHDFDVIYVALSKDEKGEGIIALQTPFGSVPAVFGHTRMIVTAIESLKHASKKAGKEINVYKFKKTDLVYSTNEDKEVSKL